MSYRKEEWESLRFLALFFFCTSLTLAQSVNFLLAPSTLPKATGVVSEVFSKAATSILLLKYHQTLASHALNQ